jgi:hypothetical protein
LLDVDERTAAMFVEVAHEAELIEEDLLRDLVTVTAGFDDWLALDAIDRWLAIVDAWRRCLVDLSTLCRDDDRERTVMPLGQHPLVTDAVARRARIVRVLSQQVGNIVTFDSLCARLDWEAPAMWHAYHLDSSGLVRSALEDMALLGLLRDDALTSAGRAALVESPQEARELSGGLFPPVVSMFLIQPDLTALAPAELAPSVAIQLGRLTHTESRGAASLLRFTESSLREALDRGMTGDAILAFLEAHAQRGVPQSLSVLVRDAERRHGTLRVAGVLSYVRSDDPALLTQVVRAKKLAKTRLRQIAPTVAVSDVAPALLLNALRDSGFAPMAEDATGGVVVTATEVARAERPRWRRPRFEEKAEAVWAATLPFAQAKAGASGAAASFDLIVRRLRKSHDA